MQLTVTGIFVRAARSARICTASGRSAAFRASASSRLASTEAVSRLEAGPEIAFPSQSTSTEREVDPKKTAIRSQNDSNDGKEQVRYLREELVKRKKPNEILEAHGHTGVLIAEKPHVFDKTSNLSPSILKCIGRQLYNNRNHPIGITRKLIESVFCPPTFRNHININPVVSTFENFDSLGFPEDHPGRSRTDTYYVNSSYVLRTHSSAHERAAFSELCTPAEKSEKGYTLCADVYRRDSIDRSHFPVFHQMEAARTWRLEKQPGKQRLGQYTEYLARREQIKKDIATIPAIGAHMDVETCPQLDAKRNPAQLIHEEQDVRLMVVHLKRSLEYLVYRVFTAAQEAGIGDPNARLKVRWVEAYFPFTSPSFELEVFWQGEWLELLGSGITQQGILNNAGLVESIGWAWGIGIERLAMVLFGIPDIRLFWSEDARFLEQFTEGKITKFEPFSKYPPCYKDVAFWIPSAPAAASPIGASTPGSAGIAAAAGGDATKASPTDTQPAAFHENDVMEIVRDVAGSLAEDVKLVDEFVHPTTARKSLCYRINYRSLERTLTNEEVNKLHSEVVRKLETDAGLELR